MQPSCAQPSTLESPANAAPRAAPPNRGLLVALARLRGGLDLVGLASCALPGLLPLLPFSYSRGLGGLLVTQSVSVPGRVS